MDQSLAVFSNFFLHIHSVKVRREVLRPTYTMALGIISLFLFIILVATGGLLLFHYVPFTGRAYDDIVVLQTGVPFGELLRNTHRWAAHLMVVTVFLHMLRVFYTGGYKPPREFNWVLGIFIILITLFLSFTGYLLPWDQLAFWAITVGTNIAGYTPGIGEQLRFLLLGAKEVGQEALLRFYTLHNFLLPALLAVLLGVHLWRVRKDGGLSLPTEESPNPDGSDGAFKDPNKTYGLMEVVKGSSDLVEKGPENTVMAFPYALALEALVFVGTILVVLLLGIFTSPPLEELANPDVTPNPAKAPWYFLNLQELLLHMHPTFAGVIVPALLILSLLA